MPTYSQPIAEGSDTARKAAIDLAALAALAGSLGKLFER